MESNWIDNLPTYDGLAFDLKALKTLSHHCEPSLCKKGPSCCGCYEITLTEKEIDRMLPYIDQASQLAPGLKDGSDFSNIFEELEQDHLYALEEDDSGLCLFGYSDPKGNTLCALHSVSLRNGDEPHQVKPFNCWLWPLALTDCRPNVLTVQEDAFDFPCNKQRDESVPGLDPGVEEIILTLFGKEKLEFIKLWT